MKSIINFILINFLLCINSISNIATLNIKSMKFNLNKNSLWLSYPLKTTSFNYLSSKIPKNHRLSKCKIFEEDSKEYRLFFNIFQVKTQFFTGNRMEIVTITKNLDNDKLSFVILDCFTNTMSWDPIDGIQEANSKFKQKINNNLCNICIEKLIKENKNSNNQNNQNNHNYKNDKTDENKNLNNVINKQYEESDNILFKINSRKSKIKKSVLRKFSIEPNYVCYFKNYTNGYNMTFNEHQINKKVIILKDIFITNNVYTNYIKELEHAFIYPQEMNFKVFIN